MTSRIMQRTLCAAALGALLLALPFSGAAQNPAPAVPVYSLSKEIRVTGAIQSIRFGANGVPGTHLLISTSQAGQAAVIDAHLGSGFAADPAHLGLSVGQKVSVIGMMASYDGSSVLLARILTTPKRVIVLRNDRGVPVRVLFPRVKPVPLALAEVVR